MRAIARGARPAVPAAVGLSIVCCLLAGCSNRQVAGHPDTNRPAVTATAPSVGTRPTPAPTPAPKPAATTGPTSDRRRFVEVARITGHLTPKSVDASPSGFVVAQNMIYTHTISVFNPQHQLVKTISDRITPASLGYPQWSSPLSGGPVEAAFSPDGRHVWVSNYSMYGPGFRNQGHDTCSPASGYDRSFLYRIDTSSWAVDGIVAVGSVPKYVAASPDGRTVLVSNWCSYSLSIVDTGSLREIAQIPIGRYPRGIAISADSRTAYVAEMGSSNVKVVDLAKAVRDTPGAVRTLSTPGAAPRHLNLSPDGRFLYVTLNGAGRVAKREERSGKVLDTVRTGSAPRSAALSPDGTTLFVVNYESDTVSRVRTSDLKVLQSRHVDHHPIGITYNAATSEIWVCSYIGVINVFADAP